MPLSIQGKHNCLHASTTSVKETQKLLGMTMYLGNFVPHLSKLLASLWDLTEKDTKSFEMSHFVASLIASSQQFPAPQYHTILTPANPSLCKFMPHNQDLAPLLWLLPLKGGPGLMWRFWLNLAWHMSSSRCPVDNHGQVPLRWTGGIHHIYGQHNNLATVWYIFHILQFFVTFKKCT